MKDTHRKRTDSPEAIFDFVTDDVKVIAAPSNITPIVCLTDNTLAIITSFLHLEDSTPTEIHLPIVAACTFGTGFVVCLSQIDFFSTRSMKAADTSTMMRNILRLLGDEESDLGLIGFDASNTSMLACRMEDMGYHIHKLKTLDEISRMKVLAIPTDLQFDSDESINNLVRFVKNGGGLLVMYHHRPDPELQSDYPVNAAIAPFGLAYTSCLLNENLESAENIQVPPSYSYVADSSFSSMVEQFCGNLQRDDLDTSTLDDFITCLRYYISVCDEQQTGHLRQIVDACWDFLRRTEYVCDKGICPDIRQALVVVLLQDLYSKLPIDMLPLIPEAREFPGAAASNNVSEFEMTFTVRANEWTNSGMWLPASTNSSIIVVSGNCNDVDVQIGCHKESLLSVSSPWPRWPSIVSVSPLTSDDEVPVASPFGGIVYFIFETEDSVVMEERTFTVVMQNFMKHPRVVWDRPNIWEETKDLDVPWSEFDAESVIFTVPTKELIKIQDFMAIKEKYDIIVSEITRYMSKPPTRAFRVTYDVDFEASLESARYPIVCKMSDIEGTLLDLSKPSPSLFNLAISIAFVCIRENCFDYDFTHLLAELAAAVALQSAYPDFDPIEFPGISLSNGFSEFWQIQTGAGSQTIPRTIAVFQSANCPICDVPEDMWIAFVRQLCQLGRYNFTNLIERVRPIPVSVSWSLVDLARFTGGM